MMLVVLTSFCMPGPTGGRNGAPERLKPVGLSSPKVNKTASDWRSALSIHELPKSNKHHYVRETAFQLDNTQAALIAKE